MGAKRVSFVCPLCDMTILSTTVKWQERVLYSQDEDRIQYAHKSCAELKEHEQTVIQNPE